MGNGFKTLHPDSRIAAQAEYPDEIAADLLARAHRLLPVWVEPLLEARQDVPRQFSCRV